MFAAEFEAADETPRRRSARSLLALDARLAQGGLARALCKVIDISIHGARLQSYSILTRGSAIWLTLPGVGTVAADVMWADEYVAGCQFHRPLDSIAFEGLVDRTGGRAA